MGRLPEAESLFRRVLQLAQEAGNRDDEGRSFSRLGQIALRRGRLEEAEGYFQQSLAIDREAQDRQGEGADLSALGQIQQARGQALAAAETFEQALVVLREVDDVINYATGALLLARLLIEDLQQPDRGCSLLAEAIRIRHDLGLPGEEEARATAQRLGCAV
jgi:tetratricopeptide (TPR) repeat protein